MLGSFVDCNFQVMDVRYDSQENAFGREAVRKRMELMFRWNSVMAPAEAMMKCTVLGEHSYGTGSEVMVGSNSALTFVTQDEILGPVQAVMKYV